MKKALIKNGILSIICGLATLPFAYADEAQLVGDAKAVEPQIQTQPQAQVQPQIASPKNPLMDRELKKTSGDGTVTLAELIKDKKAVLLDFYATWCGPCMKLMPELEEKSRVLAPQGISVVGVNVDSRDMAGAEELRKSFKTDLPWLIESSEKIHSKHFEVTSVPRMVLLSKEGEVLFNGNPGDPKEVAKLEAALKTLGASL